MMFLMLAASRIISEGTLCPSETYIGLRSFTGLGFEAYLRKTAEEIIDCAVRVVIEDVERCIFKETSNVTV